MMTQESLNKQSVWKDFGAAVAIKSLAVVTATTGAIFSIAGLCAAGVGLFLPDPYWPFIFVGPAATAFGIKGYIMALELMR
jgi:hypothetical protein